MKWTNLSIRNKFLLPVLLTTILGMGTSSYITYNEMEETIVLAKKNDLQLLSQTVTAQVDRFLTEVKLNARHWASDATFLTAVEDSFLGESVREVANLKLKNLQRDYSYVESFAILDLLGVAVSSDHPIIPGNLVVTDKKYFQAALQGQTIISDVFENGLSGNIVFTVASPLLDFNDAVVGVFITTIRMEYFNQTIIEQISPGESGYAFVYNSEGVIIAHKDKYSILELDLNDVEYGKEMLENDVGFVTYVDEYSVKSIFYRQVSETGWSIALVADKNDLFEPLNKIALTLILLSVSVIVIIGCIVFYSASSIVRPINRLVQFTNAIARGELDSPLPINSSDEIGKLTASSNAILTNLELIVFQANNIAKGNYHVEIPSLSNKDTLTPALRQMTVSLKEISNLVKNVAVGNLSGNLLVKDENDVLSKSINTMVESLRKNAVEQDTQRKLNEFTIGLAEKTTGDFTMNEYGRKVIEYLADEFDVQLAAYYAVEKGKLIPVASYGVDNPKQCLKEFNIGEGLLGEVAIKQVMRRFDEVPDNYMKINSSLGQKLPRHLLIVPITHNAQLKAVFELGSFKRITELELSYIEEVINTIGVNVSICEARNAIQLKSTLKTQQNKLNDIMRGEQRVTEMASQILNYLTPLLGAKQSAFFLANTNTNTNTNKELTMISSYGLLRHDNVNNKYLFGEGLIGQSALEKKMLVIDNIPDNYMTIESGLGSTKPKNILVLPIIYEDVVLAVLEFAILGDFKQMQEDFLQLVAIDIGIGLNIINSAELTSLLEKTQQQAELLKQQQQELKTSNDKLSEKSDVLELQKQDIEESRHKLEIKSKDLALASKYKSEFLANMSHELRTPLNSFLLLSKGLSENRTGNLSEEQIEDLDIIYQGGSELLHLINDIMDLSKVEAGKLTVLIEDVDLARTSTTMSNLFNPIAKHNELNFSVNCDSQAPATLTTDSQRLDQILKNFLSNAFKFTSTGGVELKIHLPKPTTRFLNLSLSADNVLAFSVIDTGVGIHVDKQKEIFEAFQQEDGTTSRQYGGTGLGLTISKELARLLGGEIQLTSTQGEGSTFTLYLPLHKSQQGSSPQPTLEPIKIANEAEPEATLPVNLSEASGEQFIPDDRNQPDKDEKSFLIIEEDERFAKVLLKIVRNHGYKGLVAGDGKNGLYLALENQPVGIFMDLGLPDMDGHEVLDQLKFHLKTRHIPVQIISAKERDLASLQNGAMGFLPKPASEVDINKVLADMQRVATTEFKTTLIVDDSENSCQVVAKLIDHQGIKIDYANTGKEAISKILNEPFDCVILGIGLSDISGFEVLEQLSKDSSLKIPPIIVYTGQELRSAQRNQLQKYAATIVLKVAESPEALLDDTLLFLHSISDTLSSSQKKTIYSMHDESKLLQNRKVLLVDDDMRNTFALSKRLTSIGLSMQVADNGQTALDQLNESSDVELIIMDIMMPIMDGYEAIRQIRTFQQYKNLPIIVLTTKAMPEDRAKCIEAGANDYLTKPVDFDKLLPMLKVCLFRK